MNAHEYNCLLAMLTLMPLAVILTLIPMQLHLNTDYIQYADADNELLEYGAKTRLSPTFNTKSVLSFCNE